MKTLQMQIKRTLRRKHLRALPTVELLQHMLGKNVLIAFAATRKGLRAVRTIKGRRGRMQFDDMTTIFHAVRESWSILAEATLEHWRSAPWGWGHSWW